MRGYFTDGAVLFVPDPPFRLPGEKSRSRTEDSPPQMRRGGAPSAGVVLTIWIGGQTMPRAPSSDEEGWRSERRGGADHLDRRANHAASFPSSDEEGWRSERRGGADHLDRRTNHAELPLLR